MIKYLGSKRSMMPQLTALAAASGAKSALDLFTGTTRVAQMLKGLGMQPGSGDSWEQPFDIVGMTSNDFQFHETLCQAAANGRAFEVWQSMRAQIRAFVSVTSMQHLAPQDLVRRQHQLPGRDGLAAAGSGRQQHARRGGGHGDRKSVV